MRQTRTDSFGAPMIFMATLVFCLLLGTPAVARILFEDINISSRQAKHCGCKNLTKVSLRRRCLTAYTIKNRIICRVVYSPDLDEAKMRRAKMRKDQQKKTQWANRCCSNQSYRGYEDWVNKSYVLQCIDQNLCTGKQSMKGTDRTRRIKIVEVAFPQVNVFEDRSVNSRQIRALYGGQRVTLMEVRPDQNGENWIKICGTGWCGWAGQEFFNRVPSSEPQAVGPGKRPLSARPQRPAKSDLGDLGDF